jgi:glycosyltransferase involved in cell wall biosynthesis
MHGSDVLDERQLDDNHEVVAELLRGASAVTCVSRYLADAFTRKLPSLPRPEVVHNFLRRGFAEHLPPPQRERHRLLHVSSLRPVKRPELLLSTFALVARRSPQAQLRIVTTQMGRRRADELLASFDMRDRVTVLDGSCDEHLLTSEYARADALLLTSRFESFGLVILEALACGAPVIAPAVAGIPEILGDDWPLLVKGDVDSPLAYAELAFATEKALPPDELRARRRSILERFDRNRQVERYLAVYRGALAGTGRSAACRG